jgi:dihydrofolate reductase
MHLLFEGVSIWMYKHWTGTFFSDASLNNPDQNSHILPRRTWEVIGQIMKENAKAMPSEFGRAPNDIFRHSNGFKAEEWTNWTMLYSLPLLMTFQSDRR